MIDNILTIAEVSEKLKVSESTVRTMVRCDGMPHVRIGKRIIIDSQQLELWLRDRLHNEIATGG
jgi:excisionase family DNA binding protein